MRRLLVVYGAVVFLGIGCAEESPTAPASQPDQAADVPRIADPPKADPKVTAFKDEVTHFLGEARAGAKLLTLNPSLEQIRAKSSEITELYIHLPEVPPQIDSTREITDKLKSINGMFKFAVATAEQRDDSKRSGFFELVKKWRDLLEQTATKINETADEVESAIGL